MCNINQFPFYKNYYELLDNLPVEDKRLMLEVIVDFVFKDKEPKGLEKMNLAIWNNIKLPLTNVKKNILNGQKGGRPKKEIKNPKENPKENPKRNPKENPKRNPKEKQIYFYISNFIFLFNNIIILNSNNKDIIYNLLKEYLEIRLKEKYIVNETVIKRLVKKLNEYGKTDEEKIEIIENAINGKWKDFYELKKEKRKESFYEQLDKW